MSEDRTAEHLLALIAAEHAALRDLVAALDYTAISRRPASGQWSIMENIRHLLFAEQAHLGRYVPDGRKWSAAGYTPQTMRDARDVSRPPSASPSLGDVLSAWDALHRATAATLTTQDSPAVRTAVARNLKHLRAHVNVVRRLVRES